MTTVSPRLFSDVSAVYSRGKPSGLGELCGRLALPEGVQLAGTCLG